MSDKKEILIVEDGEILLKLQSLLLSSRGYLVKGVASGKAALESLAKKKPDLVVLDISKEAMDVFEVCRKIKSEKATRNVPVIIMSSKQSSEDIAKGEQVGADCFLSKPLKSVLLVNAVHRLMAGSFDTRICFS